MKLDFESNVSTFAAVTSDFSNQNEAANSVADVSKMLREGIEAAQNGKSAEARTLLLRVTEVDANNEKAWLWLASISEYPEELLVFLNNVLKINPENARALEWAKATKNLLSKTFVQRGIDAANDQKDFAKQCFLQAVNHDSQNEMAWLWLASVSDSEEEKSSHLEKVLSINPENETAKSLLEAMMQKQLESLFQEAQMQAVEGKNAQALESLENYLSQSPKAENAWILKGFLVESLSEKLECFDKSLQLNADNRLAQVNAEFLRSMFEKESAQPQISEATETVESPKEEVELDLPEYSAEEKAEFSDSSVEEVSASENVEDDQPQFEESALEEMQFSEANEMETQMHAEETEYSFSKEPQESNQVEFQAEESSQVYEYQTADLVVPQPSLESVEESGNAEISMENNAAEVYEFEETQAVAENNYSHIFTSEEEKSESPFAETSVNFSEQEPQHNFEEQNSDTANYYEEENPLQSKSETVECPFCEAKNEVQSFVCYSCRGVMIMSDLEMVLGNQEADKEMIGNAICLWEAERERGELNSDELKTLALGYLNLGNAEKGLNYLKEASKMNPNDFVLSSQVNALKIRLAEIEKQKEIHDSEPKNLTILVVDDSATVRKLISGKLEKSGHEVVCATDGIEALERMKEFVPDLVLLDINMPQMDGYQVCKMIRANEATKDIPVVMISGKDGFFDKVRGRMAGTTGYITKPFGPETLMKTVETYTAGN